MPAKLLILTTDLERGGTPAVVRGVAAGLAGRGHDLEVASLAPWGVVSGEIQAGGTQVHALNASGPGDLAVARRLYRLIRQRGYSHVFSLLVHANAVAAAVRPFLPEWLRWFQSIQTTQPNPAWHWSVQHLIAPGAERIIVPSRSVATIATDCCGVPAERISVIPNAVDVNTLSELPKSASTAFRVGFLGRLDPVKRVQDLIRAMALMEDLSELELHIFGDGPERRHLEAIAAKTFRTRFHGSVSWPGEALSQMDVLVLPSEAEGFGLVLIEAMAADVPVVASDVPGIRDVVRHGETGLLFPKGDLPSLAAAIKTVRRQPALRNRLTAAGRADVRTRFGWPAVLDAYEATLDL